MNRLPEALMDRLRAALPISTVVARRVPLKRVGKQLSGLCPFHNERSASFTVSDQRGTFKCFGCGAGGDVFGWFMRTEGVSFPVAVERVAAEAGIDLPDRPRHAPRPVPVNLAPPPPREPTQREIEAEERRAWFMAAAARIWKAAGPLDGIARAYLTRRHLWPLPEGADQVLRSAHLKHPATELLHPVLLARVDGPDGQMRAIHRTYLTPEGEKLSGQDRHGHALNAKLALGPIDGCAIRLSPPVAHLGFAEGIETALAAWRLTGVPCWACISATELQRQAPPFDVQRATIFADRDDPKGKPEGTGLRAARVLHAELRRQGVPAEICLPSEPWGDYADVLADLVQREEGERA
ncbi:toprim domain-containing protein [Roseococcus sp. SDR]|uniref:CHC2 zinc finger domain-containing protein n=1 Tax=Roseococcus sp. SDR TaxID=2835532 RepID=UPI001BCF3B92|nr:CHC2 zinc finger domain-containing protein [Roseococcus sp. SDR]MBS7789259.1 toprim domain-containing protein [Roseococcus sp. SDR]MBV1844573.1 toprim domain-containing protein [Roseococcus sp. SDR]